MTILPGSFGFEAAVSRIEGLMSKSLAPSGNKLFGIRTTGLGPGFSWKVTFAGGVGLASFLQDRMFLRRAGRPWAVMSATNSSGITEAEYNTGTREEMARTIIVGLVVPLRGLP